MLFVVLTGGAVAISPLSLAMILPLAAICAASFGLGVFVEMMMVQWTVTMARNIPPEKLARVSSYDVLGSVMAMPAGALIAGPLGSAIGTSRAEYAAAAAIVLAAGLALIPRDIRTIRNDDADRLHGAAAAGTAGPGKGPPFPPDSDVLGVRAERQHRHGHGRRREHQQPAAAHSDRTPVR